MHVKRQTIAKTWSIPRKGTKYVVRISHDKKNGIPILIILRNILKLATNRGEARKILQEKLVYINGKIIKNENYAVLPFDILKIGNKLYELGFSEKGKFEVKETTKTEKTFRVNDKKVLKGKKIQLNLLYGENILTDKNVKTGSSVTIKDGKIIKVIEMEKGKEVVIFSGKYQGKKGKIEKIEMGIATISSENKKINIPSKNIIVIS